MRLSLPAILAAFVGALVLRLGIAPLIEIDAFSVPAAVSRLIELAAAAGVIAAALSFERDDPPLRPWAALALGIALVPLARLALFAQWMVGDAKVGHILLILSNIVSIAAIAGFRRVLVSTGLTPEWTPSARSGAGMVFFSIAAAVLGLVAFQVVELLPLHRHSAGDLIAAGVSLISTACDGILCAGGILLVWLVRPMLGGSVALPYVLVAFGGAVFLIVDIFHVLLQTTTQDQFGSPLPIAVGTIGWVALGLAGVSQRLLVRAA